MIGSLGESEFRSRQNEGNAHDEQENSQNHRQAEIGDDAWRVDFRIVEHAARPYKPEGRRQNEDDAYQHETSTSAVGSSDTESRRRVCDSPGFRFS